MKSMLNLFFILLATVSFCQTDLQAEIQTLESEIKSLDKEISSLESQRDQGLNAQQLIIDEKQKEEDQKQQIVDQINDEIEDLNTKLSNYGVSKDNLDIYNLLHGKKIYKAQLSDKKMIKFLELIAVLTDDVPDVQDYLFTENQIYYGTTQDGVIMDLIEIPLGEKEIKQFDKLKSKGILNVVNDISRLLKKMTLIDKRYFDLKDSLNVNSNKLNQAKNPLEKVIDQKENLINSYKEINIRFSNNIDKKTNIITNKHGRIFAIEKRKTEIENLQREENITRIAEEFNKSAKTCKIGKQTWMTTNLSVTHFSNGDSILLVNNFAEWEKAYDRKIPAYSYPKFDKSLVARHGLVYNYFTLIDARGIEPNGWYVARASDYDNLCSTYNKKCWSSNSSSILTRYNCCSTKDFRTTFGWGYRNDPVRCPNCKNWNSSYRKQVPCHVCKNTRVKGSRKVSLNGNNSSGLSIHPMIHLQSNRSSWTVKSKFPKFEWTNPQKEKESVLGPEALFWTSSKDFKGRVIFAKFEILNDIMMVNEWSTMREYGLQIRLIKDE